MEGSRGKEPPEGQFENLESDWEKGGRGGSFDTALTSPPFLDCYTGKERKEKGAGENRKKIYKRKGKRSQYNFLTAEGWGKMNWRKGSPPSYPFYPPKNELLLLLLRGKESRKREEREKKGLDLSYFSRDDDKEIGLPGFFSFRDFLLLLQGRPSSSHCPYFAFFREEKEEEEETFSLDFTIIRPAMMRHLGTFFLLARTFPFPVSV